MKSLARFQRWIPARAKIFSVTAGLSALSVAVLLQGCAPTPAPAPANNTGPITTLSHIKIDGTEYPSEAAALAARQSAEDTVVTKIASETDPIVGRLRIILPDHDRLRPLIAQQQALALKRVVTGEALEFFDSEQQQNLHEEANALVKSGAFQTATIEEQNDVIQPPDGDADFIVWYQVRTLLPNNTGVWLGNWLVRRRGVATTAGASTDPGTAIGAPRLASFVKSVREAALRLGGHTAAGKTSANLPARQSGGATSTGSGIIINKAGAIVTNAHVVNNCIAPKIVDSANARYTASIVAKDDANDLAVVKADHRWPEAASFRDGNEIRPGDTVVVTGFPLTGLISSSMVVTTGSVSALTGPRDDSRMMQISAPVQPGNSGGAALDASGHVIGVVTSVLSSVPLMIATGATPQNVNFATKATIVRNFLTTAKIDYAHAPSTQELPPADIAALARKFTVRIECGS